MFYQFQHNLALTDLTSLLREVLLLEWGPLGVRLPLSKQLSADSQRFHAQPFSACREQSGDGFARGVCVHTHVLKELVQCHGLFFQWQDDCLDSVSYTHLTLPTIYSV